MGFHEIGLHLNVTLHNILKDAYEENRDGFPHLISKGKNSRMFQVVLVLQEGAVINQITLHRQQRNLAK